LDATGDAGENPASVAAPGTADGRAGAADAVVDALERALAEEPGNVALRLHVAEVRLRAGDAARALELCAAAVAADSGNAAALQLLARAMGAVSGGEPGARPDVHAGGGLAPVQRLHAVRVPAAPDGAAWEVEAPGLTLADVGGLERVKARLRTSFLAPLRNPALRQMYGKSLRGGLLLWGPPGCGKTFVARAVAGELGARFVAVGLEDVLGSYHGESEQNLHSVFAAARRNSPCVLFFDELDALGHKRSKLQGGAGHNVVVQMLQELDGVAADANEGLFVLGATNQPWDVDPALRRPGRFDRMLLVLPPDAAARRAILAHHLRDRPVGGDVDLDVLAAASEGLSGADLALVCESAAELAIERALETGEAGPVGMADLRAALSDVGPSTGSWLHLAKVHAQFAADGGVYDEVLSYLRGAQP
jgi:AAA+ superfamily predicted ATPase